MSRLDDKTLQRLHDDDLSPREREEAEARLAESPEDERRLESLGQLGTLLRGSFDQAADGADLDGLWARVQAELPKAPRASAWERLRVWLGESMGVHPFRWVGAGAAVTAAAVALTLFVLPRVGEVKVIKPAVEASRNQLDIERLDFEGRHPDIYQIEDGKRSTTVIWVYPDDDDDDSGGPARPTGGGSEDI